MDEEQLKKVTAHLREAVNCLAAAREELGEFDESLPDELWTVHNLAWESYLRLESCSRHAADLLDNGFNKEAGDGT